LIFDKIKKEYKQIPFLKRSKNGDNFYTFTTFPEHDSKTPSEDHEILIYTDKPDRETSKVSITTGLHTIFRKPNGIYTHNNIDIKKDHLNGTINMTDNKGNAHIFPVTFTGCTPPSSNMLINWIRSKSDIYPIDHIDLKNKMRKKEKNKLKKIYDKLKNKFTKKSLEETVLDFLVNFFLQELIYIYKEIFNII
jgi:hypothetical protein